MSGMVTGIALGWIGAIALASVVRKPKSSCSPSTGALLGPRRPRQGVQRPAKAKRGLSWARDAPAGHDELAFAILADSHNRSHLVREDRGRGGTLPARSCFTAKRSRIAD